MSFEGVDAVDVVGIHHLLIISVFDLAQPSRLKLLTPDATNPPRNCASKYIGKRRHGSLRKIQLLRVMAGLR